MNRGTVDHVRDAIGQFATAVQHDPAFARGWARLAETRHLLVMMGAVPPGEAYPQASEESRRALALDPTLADAHLARGLVELWFDWRPDLAAASFAQALALNDSLAAAHHDYAWALLALGRVDEAIAQITTARDLDPLSARANNDIGWLYLQLRRAPDAARACQHTLAIQPGSLEAQACLERAYTQRGLYNAALEAARASTPGFTTDGAAGSATGRGVAHRVAVAARAADHGRAVTLDQSLYAGDLSTCWSAIATLRSSNSTLPSQQRVGMLVFLAGDPALDPLRDDPRFRALTERVTSLTLRVMR